MLVISDPKMNREHINLKSSIVYWGKQTENRQWKYLVRRRNERDIN